VHELVLQQNDALLLLFYVNLVCFYDLDQRCIYLLLVCAIDSLISGVSFFSVATLELLNKSEQLRVILTFYH
jgi:hypothetical protein